MRSRSDCPVFILWLLQDSPQLVNIDLVSFRTLGHIDDLIARLAPGQEVGVIIKQSHENHRMVIVFVGFAEYYVKSRRRIN
jgi:hypothetical protein